MYVNQRRKPPNFVSIQQKNGHIPTRVCPKPYRLTVTAAPRLYDVRMEQKAPIEQVSLRRLPRTHSDSNSHDSDNKTTVFVPARTSAFDHYHKLPGLNGDALDVGDASINLSSENEETTIVRNSESSSDDSPSSYLETNKSAKAAGRDRLRESDKRGVLVVPVQEATPDSDRNTWSTVSVGEDLTNQCDNFTAADEKRSTSREQSLKSCNNDADQLILIVPRLSLESATENFIAVDESIHSSRSASPGDELSAASGSTLGSFTNLPTALIQSNKPKLSMDSSTSITTGQKKPVPPPRSTVLPEETGRQSPPTNSRTPDWGTFRAANANNSRVTITLPLNHQTAGSADNRNGVVSPIRSEHSLVTTISELDEEDPLLTTTQQSSANGIDYKDPTTTQAVGSFKQILHSFQTASDRFMQRRGGPSTRPPKTTSGKRIPVQKTASMPVVGRRSVQRSSLSMQPTSDEQLITPGSSQAANVATVEVNNSLCETENTRVPTEKAAPSPPSVAMSRSLFAYPSTSVDSSTVVGGDNRTVLDIQICNHTTTTNGGRHWDDDSSFCHNGGDVSQAMYEEDGRYASLKRAFKKVEGRFASISHRGANKASLRRNHTLTGAELFHRNGIESCRLVNAASDVVVRDMVEIIGTTAIAATSPQPAAARRQQTTSTLDHYGSAITQTVSNRSTPLQNGRENGSLSTSSTDGTNLSSRGKLSVTAPPQTYQIGPLGTRYQERYTRMVNSQISTLKLVLDQFHDKALNEMQAEKLEPLWERLSWSDFYERSSTPLFQNNQFAFYNVDVELTTTRRRFPVTIMLSLPPRLHGALPAVESAAHFCPVFASIDHFAAPLSLLGCFASDDTVITDKSHQQCRLKVLPSCTAVATIPDYSRATAGRHHSLVQPTKHEKEVCFIMIQLLSALKHLQSVGREEATADLHEFLLITIDDTTAGVGGKPSTAGAPPQLCLVSGDVSGAPTLTLCRVAVAALGCLMHGGPVDDLLNIVSFPVFGVKSVFTAPLQQAAILLSQEKAYSLTLAKNLLEYTYWVYAGEVGETSIALGQFGTSAERWNEILGAQFWIDEQRAAHVQRLFNHFMSSCSSDLAHPNVFTVEEFYRLQFLCSTAPKSLFEAQETFLKANKQSWPSDYF